MSCWEMSSGTESFRTCVVCRIIVPVVKYSNFCCRGGPPWPPRAGTGACPYNWLFMHRCNKVYSETLSSCLFKLLGQPHLDNRLAGHPESTRFLIQGMNHPNRKIDIDPALLLFGTACTGQIKVVNDAFALIKIFVEIFSFHKVQSPLVANAGPR